MTLTKISLNIPTETKAILKAVYDSNGFNTTTQIIKGIALLKYILDAQNRGASIKVTEKDGSSRYVEVMF